MVHNTFQKICAPKSRKIFVCEHNDKILYQFTANYGERSLLPKYRKPFQSSTHLPQILYTVYIVLPGLQATMQLTKGFVFKCCVDDIKLNTVRSGGIGRIVRLQNIFSFANFARILQLWLKAADPYSSTRMKCPYVQPNTLNRLKYKLNL